MSPITALLYISINKLPGICAKLQPGVSYHALNHQLRRPSHDTVARAVLVSALIIEIVEIIEIICQS